MNQISVLVVEDDTIEAIRLENNLEELGFKVLAVADNVKDALGVFYSTNPDIVLIDIKLKGDKDGIELGKNITSNQKYEKPIIYLTSVQEYETFQRAKATNPYAYLNKPVSKHSLQHAIELALQQFAVNKYGFSNNTLDNGIFNRDFVFVKKGKKMIRLAINDINYIEVESKYCTLNAIDNKLLVRIALIDLLKFLPLDTFQRISRNFVVNLDKIKEFDFEDMTVLLDKKILAISQKYKKELITKLGCLQ